MSLILRERLITFEHFSPATCTNAAEREESNDLYDLHCRCQGSHIGCDQQDSKIVNTVIVTIFHITHTDCNMRFVRYDK